MCDGHTYTLVFWSESIWKEVCLENAELQREFVPGYARQLLDQSEGLPAKHFSELQVIRNDKVKGYGPLSLHGPHLRSIEKSKTKKIGNSRAIISEQTLLERSKSSASEENDDMRVKDQRKKNSKKKRSKFTPISTNFEEDSSEQESFDVGDSKTAKESRSPPLLYSQYSGWKGAQMVDLLDLCRDLDPQAPKTDEDFIELLKAAFVLPQDITSMN